MPIQVKAQTKGDLSVDAKKYLDIQFDGDLQTIKGKSKDIERSLIFVLVQIGINIGLDDFYIYEQGIVQDLIYEGHSSFLENMGESVHAIPRAHIAHIFSGIWSNIRTIGI